MISKTKAKDLVQSYIDEKGIKSFSRGLKKEQKFQEYIAVYYPNLNTKDNMPELCYLILNELPEEYPNCKNGNRKKFNSLNAGYKDGCGKTGSCKCLQEKVGKSLKKSFSSMTLDQKKKMVEKRSKTNLKKYGVENSGQTEKAKQRHKEFYLDTKKVAEAVQKGKDTMFGRYGVTGAFNIPEVREKAKQAMLEKYGVETPMQCAKLRDKMVKTRMKNSKEVNYNNAVEKLKQRNIIMVSTLDEYEFIYSTKMKNDTKFRCGKCNIEWKQKYASAMVVECPNCKPYTPPSFISNGEKELGEFISGIYDGPILKNSQKIIGKELDLYLPEKKIAIEYNGLFWHSEKKKSESINGKDRSYHLRKTELCLENSISLIHIFSDEWDKQQEIVKSVIRSKLGLINEKYRASDFNIESKSKQEVYRFLNVNHLQGYGRNASLHYCLSKNSEIFAVLTVAKHQKYEWEILRFCTKLNVKIHGGFSKLFKEFIKELSPRQVMSYADRRYSNGEVYNSNGFVLDGKTSPGYFYITDHYATRISRRKMMKKDIATEETKHLSEEDIAFSLGYDRIWDCGHLRFVRNFT